ncbi:MAG TPA: pilus assembly PilX N-terminal domain-containing protein, partial [Planctomycetota bacterium]
MNAPPGGSRRRGVVLIVVLSCLAVLSLVAVAFAVINSLDRDTASNFRLTTQARLVARAGVEHAVSRLSTSQALASALIDGGEWMYYGNDMSGTDPSKRGVSLTTAKRPSYAIMSAPGKPEQVRILHEGKKVLSVGVSGRMSGGEFLRDGNQYALEVRDLSGCIFLNDGLRMQGGNKSSVSENLRRILNALGREPKVKVGGLGDRVVDNRPHEGYASWMHFAAIMKKRAGLEDEEIQKLERFLTVHAWVDPDVVNPVPFSRAAAARYPVKYERGEEMVFRRGAGKDYLGHLRAERELGWIEDPSDRSSIPGTTAAVYGLDELFPGYVEVVH